MTDTKQLRVLHVHSGNMLGGVESVLLTFGEHARTCPEFEQEFVLAFEEPFAKQLRATGAQVHVLPEMQLRNPLSVRRSRREAQNLLQRAPFDCAISHSPWCQVVYASAVRRANIPLIFWMHNNFDGHWLQKLASRYAPDMAICNSAFTRSTLPSVYPASPSRIIHYPVGDTPMRSDARESLRNELNVASNTVVILMASRADSWKGHRNLLQAAGQIDSRKDWVIWIAGAPQTPDEQRYFESLQTETARLQLSKRVRFLGHRSDVPALLRAADIYCQPNVEPEPFGVVFVEALQAGVPVVTFEMGGPREILTEGTGILVPPGDIAGLANALVRLIDDRDLRVRLGVGGPARAKQLCDPAQQIRRVYELLSAWCNR